MLLATNEDTDGWDVRFRSSDYATQNATDIQFRPKLEIRWTLATRTTYFLKDHLGTTRAAITDAGDVVGYDDYDPWGLILKKRSMTSQPNMPFKYTGKEWDDDNGLNLYYFGARYYDPVVARWTSADPLADKYPSLTPYNYTMNSPIMLVDPNGKEATRSGLASVEQVGRRLSTDNSTARQAFSRVRRGQIPFFDGRDNNLFIPTKTGNFVDMKHFLTSARVSFGSDPVTAQLLGLGVEVYQKLTGNASAFNEEDNPTNALGAVFGTSVDLDKPLGPQIVKFLNGLDLLTPEEFKKLFPEKESELPENQNEINERHEENNNESGGSIINARRTTRTR